ncbi:MAG: ABC transporter ATP-binding protein [Oscillospiraceae bacterium]|nr:ABC transporter ATP-binding protein [Oscillospiraceae bacterium]
MIQVEGLTKQYGQRRAVSDLTFRIKEGEIVGFLGPNGAGKSTTMNMLTGYISATAGRATVAGADVLADPLEARRHIGYLPEQPPLYPEMTVGEYLSFVYDLKKVKTAGRRAHLDKIARMVGLDQSLTRLIKNLSKGYKQRVGLAQALVGDPSVLILDEPTVGLDPRQIVEIRQLIRSLGKARTVILSTHILQEVSAVCERLLVIAGGVIVADGTPAELMRRAAGESSFTLRVAAPVKTAATLLRGAAGVLDVQTLPGEPEPGAYDFLVRSEAGADARRSVFRALAGAGLPILKLAPSGDSLEEMFLRLTRAGAPAQTQTPDAPEAEPDPEPDAPPDTPPEADAPPEQTEEEETL